MHRVGLILVLTVLGLHPVWAQEVGLDDGEYLPLFNLRDGFDANYSSENFEQTRLNGRGVFFKRWGDQLAVLNSTRYQYMQDGDIAFSNDFRSVMIVTLNPLNSFQPYSLGLSHKSYTRFIDRRWMSGASGACSFLRSKT